MKFSIKREELLQPLQIVKGVVETRQTLPLLSNVLIQLHEGKLSLTGSDLEVELKGHIPVEAVAEPLAITVSARKLFDLCRMLPEGADLNFKVEEQRVVVKSGRSTYNLATLPAKDYPLFEDLPGQCEFEIPQNDLRYLIEHSHFAIAQQDVRYYLNGMLLDLGSSYLRGVATDGHRLAMSQTDLSFTGDSISVIVPRKAIYELLRLLENNDEKIAIVLTGNQIAVKGKQFSLTSKLIDGRFPDYNRVLPAGGDKIVEIDRDILKQTLSRVAILSNEKYRGVCLQLRSNQVTVIANNPEQEEAREELVIEYQGGDLDIGFNVNYLLDVVNTMSPGLVRFTLTDTNSGIKVEEVAQKAGAKSVYVVMPMRL